MNTYQKFALICAISALVLAPASYAHATGSDASVVGEGRYFVSSESPVIKRLFGARHSFEGGFTADLTRGELWTLSRLLRTEIRPIARYTIHSQQEDERPFGLDRLLRLLSDNDDETIEDVFERTHAPNNPTDWGARLLFNETELERTAGGDGVRIAVFDTGVEHTHPDVAARVRECVDFTRGATVENVCDDRNGHGTHLAGIIAASGGPDGEGKWGVAPDASLHIYKVCDRVGACWADDITVALRYALDRDAHIFVLPFGGAHSDGFVERMIERAEEENVLVVAAAGNSGPEEGTVQFPASHPSVIGVGALAQDLSVPSWSSRGLVDHAEDGADVRAFVAPGVDIESTWLEGEYRFLSGTSLSAAFVGAVAAHLWDGSATSTRDLLQEHAQLLGEGVRFESGLGIPMIPHDE